MTIAKTAADDLAKRNAQAYPVAPALASKPTAATAAAADAEGAARGKGGIGQDSAVVRDAGARQAAKATGNVAPTRTGLDEAEGHKHHRGHKAEAAGDDDKMQDQAAQAQQDVGAVKDRKIGETVIGQDQVIRNG